ncbi:MAG: hypothetical protein E7487_11755 [Ruminococcaceae bacterium]|nr:hypothetical protein [Oscillospiraceae bacterium]
MENRKHENSPVIYTDIPFSADLDAILNLFADGDDDLREEITAFISEAEKPVRPKAILRRVEITHTEDGKVCAIAGIPCNDSIVLNKNLAETDFAVAYIVTCGNEIDSFNCEDDPLKVYWLDALKLQALGAARQFIAKEISNLLGTSSFAHINPGSLPQWPISEQSSLFRYIGGVTEAIGVKLSESHLMIPLKSGSGIAYPSNTKFENCMVCTKLTCPNRRAPYDPHLAEKYNSAGCGNNA